jgi:hypothetical protein
MTSPDVELRREVSDWAYKLDFVANSFLLYLQETLEFW